MKRSLRLVLDNSLLLIIGTVVGLLWANLHFTSYQAVREFHPAPLTWIGGQLGLAWQGVDIRYLVNDVLMAFFFALVAKDIWEAMLPGGSLRSVRRAATPLICAVGGMAGPALIYLAAAALSNRWSELAPGWAIPCATDIAFSYLIARLVFGRHHPAVPFLLLLAIADDALGLTILVVVYPQHPLEPAWLALPAGAVMLGYAMRRFRLKGFWWYLLIPGALCWIGFALSGLHPALALIPIVLIMPHKHLPLPPSWEVTHRFDTLDRFHAWWKGPVEVILGLFGLLNAGVPLAAASSVTWIVLAALVAGKPLGIFVSGWLCTRVFRLELSEGTGLRDVLVLGCAAGIGFTVALFMATVAFHEGPVQSAAKMGALASCTAVASTFIAARLFRIKPVRMKVLAG